MMKKTRFAISCFLLLFCINFCYANTINLIPYPNKVEFRKGHLTLPFNAPVKTIGVNEKDAVSFLTGQIQIPSNKFDISSKKKSITLKIVKDKAIDSDEWYLLKITKKGVLINAISAKGLLYGISTLNQILFQCQTKTNFQLPYLQINDKPAYSYRGFMLDASRHMQSVKMVKAILDFMASIKLNVFHWHLTDGQGWRIESKLYPKLNKVASYSVNNSDPELNGYYTIEEIHEILNFAKQRNIKIIPEFDVPSHSWAVLNTFPEFRCPHAPFSNAFCVGNNKTLDFVKSLFDEIIEIFQPEYIHIGGDERKKDLWNTCPLCKTKMDSLNFKDENDLQNYFLNEVSKHIHAKNITTIAWAEHLEKGIPKNQITEAWKLKNEAITAVKMGHQVVVSDNRECYLDYPINKEEKKSKPFPSWMPILTTKTVYNFDFVPDSASTEEAKLILGGECPLWTEIVTEKQIYKQIRSRIEAHAERSWTIINSKDFDRFETSYNNLAAYFNGYFK